MKRTAWILTVICFPFLLPLSSWATTDTTLYHSNYAIHYPLQVNQLLKEINPQNMWTNLSALVTFPDRSAYHQSGIDAQNWIYSQIEAMVKNSGRNDTSLFTVKTAGRDPDNKKQPFQSDQSSIVLKIGNSLNPGVVVGAHFDTVSCMDEGCITDLYGPLPGANDDGSGVVTVLELARVLLNSHYEFNDPIYLILYAAEEQDEWGSIAVANYFKNNHIPIKAVMQFDQTGFAYNNEQTMWLETNHLNSNVSLKNKASDKIVNAELTSYLYKLIKVYVKKPVKYSCSGSSDEYSWSSKGYVAARPLESDYCDWNHMYQHMHSNQDTMDKLSLDHMTDYLKLAVAYSVELGKPK
jgi:leucyl aminopeptidase